MSTITGYPTKKFSETQKFFILDPNTQTPSFVSGADLVSYLTPSQNYVYSESTRTTAQATDYPVGALIETAGATSAGDNFAAVYLVVAAGEGDFPMDNGNELLVIKGDEFLREQLAQSTAGDGSDLIAHTGTADTVTQALNKRTIYVGSVAELVGMPSPVDGAHYDATGYHPDSDYGGGVFYWDAVRDKADHNGGTVIDPDKAFPADWSIDADVLSWFTAGTGAGCFVRKGQQDYVLSQFGGIRGDTFDASRAWDAMVASLPGLGASSAALKPSIVTDGAYRFNRGGLTADQNKIRYVRFVGREALTSRIRYYGAETYMLDYPGEGLRFYDTEFDNQSGGTRRMLRTSLPDKSDVDAVFNNCYSRGFEYLHHCFGRGHTNENCNLNTGSMCLIESPDPFNAGPFPKTQAVETGMRRYVSQNLQVDSAKSVFDVSPNGPAADYINEMTIIGTNGNTLSTLVDGGEIQMLTVKTGSLVNSFTNNYPIKCRAVIKADIDVSGIAQYDKDKATVEIGDTVLGFLRVDQAATTTDVLIDDVTIRGVLGPVRQALIRTNGRIKNLNIVSLNLFQAWEYSDLTNVFMVQCNGADPAGKILINDVTFGSDSFDASTFSWSDNYPTAQIYAGQYSAGAVPTKYLNKNRGVATVLSGNSTVTVPHNMAYTPDRSEVMLTPLDNLSGNDFYVATAFSTDFIIQVSSAVAADTDFSWSIDRGQF